MILENSQPHAIHIIDRTPSFFEESVREFLNFVRTFDARHETFSWFFIFALLKSDN